MAAMQISSSIMMRAQFGNGIPITTCVGSPSTIPLSNSTHFTATPQRLKLFSFKAKPNNNNNSCIIIPKIATTTTSIESATSKEEEEEEEEEEFDWYSQWYPIAPVIDLDKRVPHGKRVIGLDLVVWWEANTKSWQVFDDSCPHRLAPLSQGRIDQWGRLQCVYHGWCFNSSGKCQFIPQAPADAPPVHTSKKACVGVYPSTVQNGIVWFWPNSHPEFKDILQKKKPPFLPELDDPSYSRPISNRDINYGYEVLIENLMDPAHVPYAHYGILKTPSPKVKADREGGRPLNLTVTDMDVTGFSTKQDWGAGNFFAPCVYYVYPNPPPPPTDNNKVSSTPARSVLIFICVPVSPGKSRLIWSFPRNTSLWMDRFIPKWVFHLNQNLVLDSDLYLLHIQERKIEEFGPTNWHKVCFLPTKSDAIVAGYRKWLNKYSRGQVDWGSKFNGGTLPPTPPRQELLDRYRTHVLNCSSCNAAYKGLKIAETVLQVIAFGLIGVVGLTKQTIMTTIQRTAIFSVAILCFAVSKYWSHVVNCTSCNAAYKGLNITETGLQIVAVVLIGVAGVIRQGTLTTIQRSGLFLAALICFSVSKWLSHFIYKNFHFHDYNHAFK